MDLIGFWDLLEVSEFDSSSRVVEKRREEWTFAAAAETDRKSVV